MVEDEPLAQVAPPMGGSPTAGPVSDDQVEIESKITDQNGEPWPFAHIPWIPCLDEDGKPAPAAWRVFEDGRDADLRDVGQPGGHLGHVAGLGAEIEFGAQVAGELGGQISHPVGGPPHGAGLDHAGQPAQDGQIAVDRLHDLRALDLDDDLLPARQDRPVGLGDGAGRDRGPVEPGEGLGNRPPDLLLYQRPHRLGVRGRDVLLEMGELAGQARGDDIGPGGQYLTQLDEHAVGFVQSQAGLPGGIGRLVRSFGAVPEAEIGTEPVPDGDTDDLQVAAGTPGRPPDGPQRTRQRGGKRRSRRAFPRSDQKLPADRGDQLQASQAAGDGFLASAEPAGRRMAPRPAGPVTPRSLPVPHPAAEPQSGGQGSGLVHTSGVVVERRPAARESRVSLQSGQRRAPGGVVLVPGRVCGPACRATTSGGRGPGSAR